MRSAVVGLLLVGMCAGPLVVPSPGRAQAPPSGSLVGEVTGPDGTPQSGVLVIVGSNQTTTGKAGRFRVDSVAGGVYATYLYHPSHGRDTVRIPVAYGTTTGVSIDYEASGDVSRTLSVGGLAGGSEGEAPRAGESRIVGQLFDHTTDRPIEGAVVRLAPGDLRGTTSARGRFSFDSLAAGTYSVRIHHVRYGDQSVEVDVPADRTVDARIRLEPEAVEVEPVEVTVDATVRRPALQKSGYYERKERARKAGYGHFLEAEEIEGRGSEVSHLLGSVPQLTATGPISVGGRLVRGLVYFPRYMEGPFGGCLPAIYLDGHKVVGGGSAGSHVSSLGPMGVNSLVSPSEVAGIEVYESPAATAGEFQGSDSRCGVVAIWTKRQ